MVSCRHEWLQYAFLSYIFLKKKVLGTFGFFDDFWQLLVNLRGLKHAPDLNKMLMDYSNNTKVIQWHKNLWKSDKTNNKFMEKLGKRTKHTFGNWQINWLSNHVSKILTQSVVDKYIRFLGFFISVFFSIQNTDLKVVFCIHIIKPLVCLCVCLMLRPVHIFGPISNLLISTDSPWYREGLKIISRVIGAGTKKNF